MPTSLTSAQIVTLACQIAKTSGMLPQAGQLLNIILQELCQNYDLDAARGAPYTFTFNGTTGPYKLPADYLRMRKGKSFYIYNGQPYFMTYIELEEYDALIQQPGFFDFPRNITVDMANQNAGIGGEFDPQQFSSGFNIGSTPTVPTVPQAYVWPPPSIVVPVTVRYYRWMPWIATPETSAVVPWFPNQQYLISCLAGRLMQIADDDRANFFLTDKEEINAQGAGVILRRYLTMKDDPEGRAKVVDLDRRRFGAQSNWNRLPNTKSIGW